MKTGRQGVKMTGRGEGEEIRKRGGGRRLSDKEERGQEEERD
jgi:hypothetical protein